MDEDDFRDRPRQRKEPRTDRPGWEKALLDQLRFYILREPEDFVIRSAVANDIRMSNVSIIIGQCLAALTREGLLVYKVVDPKDYPEVYLGHGLHTTKVTWHDGQWIWGEFLVFKHKGFGNYKRGGFRTICRDSRALRSKKAVAKARRKHPLTPVKPEEWDGKAYFIVRGREFEQACKTAGVPTDPKSDWSCPQCHRKSRYDELGCLNYGNCNYRRPHEKYWPSPPVQSIVCKRCGTTLEAGKKAHSERVCNETIIRGVMES